MFDGDLTLICLSGLMHVFLSQEYENKLYSVKFANVPVNCLIEHAVDVIKMTGAILLGDASVCYVFRE